MEKRQYKMLIPADVKDWLEEQSRKNLRSQSQEIVLALREKMAAQEAAAKE